ncbi:Y-family DNA polymerase [Nostoc sp. DSM 114159]|jgi:DNA polymerase-4
MLLKTSEIARHIKTAIFQSTQLTATAGVSINKFLAKMASGQNKPNGLTVILPQDAMSTTSRKRLRLCRTASD